MNLLKYEKIIYTTAVLITYLTIPLNFISKNKRVEYTYIACIISVILLLISTILYGKRTLLIRQELRKTILNNKKRKVLCQIRLI